MDVTTIGPTVLNVMKGDIQSSITQIKALSNTDLTLIAGYETLSKDIDIVIGSITTYIPTTFSEKLNELVLRQKVLNNQRDALILAGTPGATGAILPTPTIKTAAPPALAAVTAATTVATTEAATEAATEAPDNDGVIKKIIKSTYKEFKQHFRVITLILGMYFGGVVGSHWAITDGITVEEVSTMYTVFYGIYGALLFPFAICWGIYSPPMWRAPFMPIYIRGKEPGWTTMFPISSFLEFFKYNPPSLDDTVTDKTFLQVMCVIIAGFCATSIFIS